MPLRSSAEALGRALGLAARGRYRTSPNPRVGALVVRDGAVVGQGWHREVGGPHAEVFALGEAGQRARGATLYVNLEPCSHHGRTPPCVEAVLTAGIARVVACHGDPDPRVAGRGFERLRQAGVEVEVGGRALEAIRLNLPFLVSKLLGRPQVTLKWAMSLDGKIATATGESRWISSPAGRRWGLDLREEHDAILVGIGTVLADDPGLDRRRRRAVGPIQRVVLDRRLRIPPEARLCSGSGPVLVYAEQAPQARVQALASNGVAVVQLAAVEPGAVLADLARRGIQSLLVEGGAEVLASFVASRLFDRVEIDCSPRLLGGRVAPSALGGDGEARLEGAPRLEGIEVGRRGGDLILSGLREGCLRDLSSRLGA